jgi:hypothetical protein
MKSKTTGLKNLVVVSDTHCGDQLGLCPETVTLTHGGTYTSSIFQDYVRERWNIFWDEWVPTVTRGEPYSILVNGDAMEGRHHNATHPLTHDLANQQNVAYEMLAPVVAKAKSLYYVSGSPAHSGEAGENEEMLAEMLKAKADERGNRSRYELLIKVGNALVHATHHIGISGSMAYETTALTKEFNEFSSESARWNRPIADILVRSHRHRHSEVSIPTSRGYGIIFVTPSWQLRTPFAFRIPGGRVTTPMIGGSLIRQGNEEFHTRHKTWDTPRTRTEKPRIEVI